MLISSRKTLGHVQSALISAVLTSLLWFSTRDASWEYWAALNSGLGSFLALQNTASVMETRLGIRARWTPNSSEWKNIKVSIAEQEYQGAIDHLKGVAVAWLFELKKANQALTGKFIHSFAQSALILTRV